MQCGACSATNRDEARFCAQCGGPLALNCDSCGRELAVDVRFCDGCGTAVPPAGGALQDDDADEAVRKIVTVLFADLGGSTGFGERVDPEAAREVMAEYHQLLQECVDSNSGTVAKFIGDGMMATFGLPELAEDDAVRAVRAGAEMQRRFGAFADRVVQRLDEHLTFRVGINTGEVVVAEGDADLVGDALNVAARLEGTAEPGAVLVGEETWRPDRHRQRVPPVLGTPPPGPRW